LPESFKKIDFPLLGLLKGVNNNEQMAFGNVVDDVYV
jgi:hypothetical protein